ncbi:hypothetical protein psal_cds_386 [Pandoravirus salinus]|uniref:Sulfhydryl oxidase n=1 Tax=Pandoravirus salinus TaxID=1349410 RepID=S4VX94_9VIRU|nr:hypothetical protein psal_cds_386 [Pandoravirus salinus]AGO84071.1 hypothetical protein psal_cds_386 [Pandoravirus salinus]
MDTQMWGPLVWDFMAVAARACDDLDPDPPEAGRDGPRQRATRAFVLLAYSLRHVLPCSFCRTSYCHYIEDVPPGEFVLGSDEAARARRPHGVGDRTAGAAVPRTGRMTAAAAPSDASGDLVPRAPTLVDWVWIMHDRVNRKLGVKNMLTRRRFRKRLRVTAALVHPSAVWDMVTIIALNYPTDGLGRVAATAACDPEQRAKRTGHVVFLDALARLLPLVPDLGSLAPYVNPRSALYAGALAAREPFVAWVRRGKRAWLRDVGADAALCARMLAAERAYMASVA